MSDKQPPTSNVATRRGGSVASNRRRGIALDRLEPWTGLPICSPGLRYFLNPPRGAPDGATRCNFWRPSSSIARKLRLAGTGYGLALREMELAGTKTTHQ